MRYDHFSPWSFHFYPIVTTNQKQRNVLLSGSQTYPLGFTTPRSFTSSSRTAFTNYCRDRFF